MHILRQGYPFIGAMLVIAVILYLLFGVFGIVLPLLLAAYFAYFFRNPYRDVKKDPNIFYSPADGTVMGVTEFYDDEYLNADAKKVTIFLSVLDVHVNRAPWTVPSNTSVIPSGITCRRMTKRQPSKTNGSPSACRRAA